MHRLILAVLLALAIAAPAQADYGSAMRAYDRRDYKTAFPEFQRLAEAGNRNAQYMLGLLYALGYGTPQDDLQAHLWFDLAAAAGRRDAARARDDVARRMSSEQVARAQRLAREWRGRQKGARQGPDRETVRQVQARLARLGYDPGPADGRPGRRTAQAIRQYQREQTLEVTGKASKPLLARLDQTLEARQAPHQAPAAVAATPARPAPAPPAPAPVTPPPATPAAAPPVQPVAPSPVLASRAPAEPAPARRPPPAPAGGAWRNPDLEPVERGAAPPPASPAAPLAQPGMAEALREIIAEGRRSRAADRWFLERLEALADRYASPVRPAGRAPAARARESLLVDERFADGDYLRDPAWRVVSGRFSVQRGRGLRVAPGASVPGLGGQGGELGAIVGSLIDSRTGGRARQVTGGSEIDLPLAMDNAFGLDLDLESMSRRGRLEIGVYQGARRSSAYRLVYLPGPGARLELHRVGPRGRTVLQAADRIVPLEDGRVHRLEWLRDRGGVMSVRLDARGVIRVTDRSVLDPFDGIQVLGLGGEYLIGRVRVTRP